MNKQDFATHSNSTKSVYELETDRIVNNLKQHFADSDEIARISKLSIDEQFQTIENSNEKVRQQVLYNIHGRKDLSEDQMRVMLSLTSNFKMTLSGLLGSDPYRWKFLSTIVPLKTLQRSNDMLPKSTWLTCEAQPISLKVIADTRDFKPSPEEKTIEPPTDEQLKTIND